MAKSIDNTDDVIDSRDVIERISELRAAAEGDELSVPGTLELAALLRLQSQCDAFDDWEHGLGLVRDSYFKTYAQELADDIGAVDRNAKWPMNCIDWEQAARELQHDYTSVDFDGVTYRVRS